MDAYEYRGVLVREIRRDPQWPIWGHDYTANPVARSGWGVKYNDPAAVERGIDHWLDRSCRNHRTRCP